MDARSRPEAMMKDTSAASSKEFAASAKEGKQLHSAAVDPEGPERFQTDKDLCVFNRNRESFLSLTVKSADTHLARLKGLLGRSKLKSDEGLWTIPCQGVHTMFVLFPMDLIYLDADNRVVHMVENLGSFRIAPIRMDAASVLQLQTRTIYSSNTQIGDQLLICSPLDLVGSWKKPL
jgi:uncharacterized membrane protein (UPF0127 family)